jgi:hypothetical protein
MTPSGYIGLRRGVKKGGSHTQVVASSEKLKMVGAIGFEPMTSTV